MRILFYFFSKTHNPINKKFVTYKQIKFVTYTQKMRPTFFYLR